MKKIYEKPAMLVVRLQQMQMLCESQVTGVDGGDTGIGYGGGSDNDPSGPKVKEQSSWDEEW